MKTTVVIAVLFLNFTELCYSQSLKQGSIWYVEEAKIDFKYDPPKVTPHNKIIGQTRPSTICDENGDLLFYTNGITVWNRYDEIMLNGERINTNEGYYPVTSVIVPHPGDGQLYYIFICNNWSSLNSNSPKGFHYAVVDMSQDNGNGAVVQKEINLVDPVSDLLTVVNHAEEQSFWVVTHGWENNLFYAFRVSPSGISPPVITSIGNSYGNFWNQLKASPDGSKLAVANYGPTDLYDFNAKTGKVSNVRYLEFTGAQGIEFSPNSELLYVGNYTGVLDQYDVSLENINDILQSKTTLVDDYGEFVDLQLAYNGKIYAGAPNFQVDEYIIAVDSPNVKGIGCKYIDEGLKVPFGNIFYFPLAIQSFFRESPAIPQANGCKGVLSQLKITSLGYADSIEWDFGDGTKKTFAGSSGKNVNHIYTGTGDYNVKATKYISTISRDITSTITIHERPQVKLIADTVLCKGEELILDPGGSGVTYKWLTGEETKNITVSTPGVYKVIVNDGMCTNSDEVEVQVWDYPEISLGPDKVFCNDEVSTQLFVEADNDYTYLWSTGETVPSIDAENSGQYNIQVSHGRCISKDTINVHFASIQSLTFLDTTLIIPFDKDLKLLQQGTNAKTWKWNFGDGEEETLNSPDVHHHYNEAGSYQGYVEVSNDFGCAETSPFHVEVPYHLFIPNVFTPNDDNVNESFEIQYNGSAKKFNEIIYDRYGKEVFSSQSITDKWKASEVSSGLYYYNIKFGKDIYKGWVQVIK